MNDAEEPLRILHVILAVRETSAPYNEHCLPWADKRDITICSYFRSDVTPPSAIRLFAGDGSLTGFVRALRSALGAGEYDVIHAHSPHVALLFLVATLRSRTRYAASTVVTVHDSYQNFKLRNRLMFLPVFAGFGRVVCCGRASFESFPRFYKKLAGDRIGFVPNGLDIERVDRIAKQAREQPRRTSEFTIVAISRLVDIKNPFGVLAAYRESAAPASHLTYIGDGPLRGALVSESRRGAENSIEFTGLIAREKVFEHLLGSDLFVSMSRGEGLPVAVLEAMACGRPVLLSDIPPHREIAEGVPFIPLVRPDDIPGFARELRRYGEMPASERAAIGRECRKLVEERFSLAAMHAGYARVYGRVAGR